MKKYVQKISIASGFVASIALCVFLFAPIAHAQTASSSDSSNTTPAADSTSYKDVICAGPGGYVVGAVIDCDGYGLGHVARVETNQAVSGLGDLIVRAVALAILSIANFFLGLAGTLLNWVVVKTVFEFGSLIGNSPGMLIAWGILRDIGNIMLLFGFIFMGLATILNLQTFAVRKALPPLIIVAILMNFSLFAAEAVIDTSNALTTALYRETNSAPCTGILDGGNTTIDISDSESQKIEFDTSCAVSYGIAGHIMQSTGLSSVFAANEAGDAASVTVYVMLAVFATIGAVVLTATAIMLVIRVVVLSFIMVAAPIGFIGMAIPPMRKFATQWWRRLFSQSFFAPVLFLLILISLKITDSFTGINGDAASATKAGLANKSLAGALMQPGASEMGIILIFTLVIGFLVASLVVAKNMGAMGATFAINTAGRITGGAVIGTSGWVGRRTAGRGSAAVARSIRNSSLGDTEVGRHLATFADKGAKASFDLRGTKALQNVSKKASVNLGAAQKGGIAGEIDKKKKARVEYAKSLSGRTETDDEYKTRIESLQNASKAAAEATNAQLEVTNKADSAHQNSKNDVSDQEKILEHLRTLADRNPEDADLKKRIRDQERAVADATKKAAGAEQRLAEETNKLTAARQNERKTRETEDEAKKKGKVRIDKKQQQEKYAQNLEDSWKTGNENKDKPWRRTGNGRPLYGVTGRANEESAKAIRAEMKKTKAEKLLEDIKSGIKSGKDDTEHKLDEVKDAIKEEHKDEGHGGGDDHSDHH